jgi:biotin carboxyl carrier protein
MTIVSVAFAQIGYQSRDAVSIPAIVWGSQSPVQSQEIVPSASNQQSAAAPGTVGKSPLVGVLIKTDTNIYVASGANPNALTETTSRIMLLAGDTYHFYVQPGDKVAVVNA